MKHPLFAVALFLLAQPLPASTVLFWEELPYFQAADSPFYEGIRSGAIFLEDFEDHELNTPHIVSWDWPNSVQVGRTTGVAAFSVDADDGLNGDFRGHNGDAWTTSSASTGGILGRMEFRFTPDILGRYPTFVGFVVTEAFNPFDNVELSITTPTWTEDWPAHYDPHSWVPRLDSFPGDTRQHRFFGVYIDRGVTGLNIGNVSQIDHLQYGYAIPEPSVIGLLWGAALADCLRRRRDGMLGR